MLRIFFLISALIILSSTSAFASPKDDLAQTQKEASAANAEAQKLEADSAELTKKRAELTARMIKSAAAIQLSEARLSAAEEKLRVVGVQIKEKTDLLTSHKKDLANMVKASIKLSETPPEAIIIMPGNMMDNMKASRALKMTSDSIKIQSATIRTQMSELEVLKEKESKNQDDAVSERAQLEQQKTALKKELEEHAALQQKLNAAQREAKARGAALAKKANDLKEFIASLERENQQDIKERSKRPVNVDIENDVRPPSGDKGKLRSFRAAKGSIRVPAAGKLIQRYGTTARNETSKGITIATRYSAQVTSPYDAEVLFTGPFMEYGKVVILRHSDGFHTLLAGITKIDVSVGDFLLEGEPIGAMGDSDSNNRLYMEIRLDNQPIDPTMWIRGLNK